MTKREKIPHTASFLQTFHTAGGTAQSQYRAEVADETEAVSFVKGRGAAAPAKTIKHRGFTVRQDHAAGDLTEPQAKYVIGIALGSEGVTPQMIESLRVRLQQGFAKRAASEFIRRYKDLPRKPRQPSAEMMEAIAPGASTEEYQVSQIAKGYYAVTLPGEDVLRFFRINPGRNPGIVFVDEIAGPEQFPVRNRQRRETILATIAGDPNAGARYGQEIGRCCKCHIRLTDKTSRDLGIGPDCRKK